MGKNSDDIKEMLIYMKNKYGVKLLYDEYILKMLAECDKGFDKDIPYIAMMIKHNITKGLIKAVSEPNMRRKAAALAVYTLAKEENVDEKTAKHYIRLMVDVIEEKGKEDIQEEKEEEVKSEEKSEEAEVYDYGDDTTENWVSFTKARYKYEINTEGYIKAYKMYLTGDFEKAKMLYEREYERVNHLAGIKLARMYWSGEGGEQSYEKAYEIFFKNKYPVAGYYIAQMYKLGLYVEKNYEEARSIYDKIKNALDEMGKVDVECRYVLGMNYLYGVFEEKNENKGFAFLYSAMKKWHIDAGVEVARCYRCEMGCNENKAAAIRIMEHYREKFRNRKLLCEYGRLYYYGAYEDKYEDERHDEVNIKKDLIKSFDLFLEAAELGSIDAAYRVARMYYMGEGIGRDYKRAVKWYTIAADSGNIPACRELCDIYYHGRGAEVSYDKSYKYFKEAADRDDEYSLYMLSEFYLTDILSMKDVAKGKEILKSAAEKGLAAAQKKYAYVLVNKRNGFPSYSEYFKWMLKAAVQNDAEAQRRVGEAYEQGMGALKNKEAAVEWYERAVANSDIYASLNLVKIYAGTEKTYEIIDHLDKAVNLMKETQVPFGNFRRYAELADIYTKMGDMYYDNSAESGKKLISWSGCTQKALECYVMSFLMGLCKRDILYKIGQLYFEKGIRIGNYDEYIGRLNERYTRENMIREAEQSMGSAETLKIRAAITEEYVKAYSYIDIRNDGFEYLLIKSLRGVYECSSGKLYREYGIAALLGKIYNDEKNTDEAAKWYREAVERGSAEAMCELADIYINVKKDYERAYDVLNMAHGLGSLRGTRMLAFMYKKGRGTKRSRKTAKQLFREAADRGDKEAEAQLKKIWLF
ncbi:MAG: sel1 repeat family protein [Firmicutes bacterium]|nr:sel1 repeat family protein [Bacillota bacterium]